MNSPLASKTSASYFQFQQSLDQYVFFSPLTTGGASGRSVKIHKDLFLPFFCVVDPNTHDGQSIIRQIENLRTTSTIVRQETGSNYANSPRQSADHKGRLDQINSGFHQVLIVKNLHVHYRVSQEVGDKAPSIYIMSIRAINEDTGGAPGLYEETRFSQVVKKDPSGIDGRKVYINGATPSLKDAMKEASYATNESKNILFYCPTTATDELGIVGTSAKSRITTQTIEELANVFKSNKNPYKGISWYVEGEGVSVLAEAIKKVPGELSKHEFRFINPIANTAKLLQVLTEKKAKFEGEFFLYNRNRAALTLLGLQKDQLLAAIGKLPAGKNYDIITRKYIVKAINELPNIGSNLVAQQAQLQSPTKTFVQLIRSAGVYRK